MSIENNIFIKRIVLSDPSLPLVISNSIGLPTAEKISEILHSYEQPNHFLVGAFLNHNLIAVMGLELISAKAIIRHISVLKDFQRQGIGKKLLQHVIKDFKLNEVEAETDDESVGFYKALGFVCKPFQSQYGTRYFCSFNFHLASI